MRKFIFLALLLASFTSFAQSVIYQGNPTTYTRYRGSWSVDSILAIPIRDTTKWMNYYGNLTIRPQDRSIWYRPDSVWIQVGNGGTGNDTSNVFTGTLSDARSLTSTPDVIVLTDYGTGVFVKNDTVTVDNTGTQIITAGGQGYSRIMDGNSMNIDWFGAVGYTTEAIGVNSRNAIQAAVDAAGTHGSIYIPEGVQYYTDSTIYIPYFNFKIHSKATLSYLPHLRADGDYPIFHVAHAGFVCQNIGFQGTGASDTSGDYNPSGTAILLDRDDGTHDPNFANIDAKIENCLFMYLGMGIICNGRNLLAFNNDFSNCLNGIRVDRVPNTDCRGHQIIKNRFHSNGQGERTITGESWCVEFTSPVAFGNTIKDNVIDGKSRGFYKGGLNQNTISGNEMTLAYGPLLHIIDPAGTFWHSWEISDNKASGIQGPLLSAGTSMEYGIISEGDVNNGLISNNVISFSRFDGMHFESLNNVNVSNNYILSPNKIRTLDSAIYDGIYIGGGASNTIGYNFIRSTTANGFRHGINNKSTSGTASFNYGYNSAGMFYIDSSSAPYTNRVENNVEPTNLQSYLNTTTNGLAGGVEFNVTDDDNTKLKAGVLKWRRISGTVGAASTEAYISNLNAGSEITAAKFHKEGGLTIGNRSGLELAQNGAVNARVIYADMFRTNPVTPATANSGSLFSNSSNSNILSLKDVDAQTRSIETVPTFATASDANYSSGFATFVFLPTITANRTFNVNTASARLERMRIVNNDTSSFNWSFNSTNVRTIHGDTITVIPKGSILNLVKNGTIWINEYDFYSKKQSYTKTQTDSAIAAQIPNIQIDCDSVIELTYTTVDTASGVVGSIAIPNGEVWDLQIRGIGVASGAEAAKYLKTCIAGNVGGTASILDGGVVEIVAPMITSGMSDADLMLSASSGNIDVKVRGVEGRTINWKIYISVVKP
jgi:hypothetical protein